MSTPPHDAKRGVRGSVVILGADACLAALPATPTQLINACFAFGYDDVVPASWGDELLAVGCLDQLAARGGGPAMACICPLVREQLRGATRLGDSAVRLVSPPVAAALYVRATSPTAQRITYVGDCPGAGHPSIDIHLSPAQFLALLAERGIVPGAQRPVPSDAGRKMRDRRSHYSLPGGVPAPEWLGSEGIERTLVDPEDLTSIEASAHGGRTLIDFAPRLGGVCSGALSGCAAQEARAAVMAHEPPRSGDEVVHHAVMVSVVDEAPARTTPQARDVSWPEFVAALSGVWDVGAPAPAPAAAVAGPATAAAAPGAPPIERAAALRPRVPKRLGEEGRILPRAYQARRAATRRAAPVLDERPAAASAERLTQPSAPPYGPAWAVRRPTPASIPRAPVVREVRTRLASADRWLLSALVVAGSIMVAVLTSVLTVRGLDRPPERSALAAPARVETVFVAAAPKQPAVRVASAPPPAAESTRAPEPPRPARPTTAAAHPARERAVPARPHPTLVAQQPHRQLPNATPAVAPPDAASRSAPVAASPAAQPAARPPAASPAVPPPSTPATPAATARDTTAASNAQVLQELREIRSEIEARKHHVDSLTHALDSLKKVDPPR